MIGVALLRGINVGGKNSLSMAVLKDSLQSSGLQNVRTYINSGNVLFESEENDRDKLSRKIEEAIERTFSLNVPTVVQDKESFLGLAGSIPEHWKNDSTMKTDVLFLWNDSDFPDIVEKVKIVPGIDDVLYVPGALVWRTDRSTLGRSGLLRLVGTPLYKKMTVRNVNTVRTLAGLLSS